jgi:broad specificity phosphatase PhoE
MLADPGVTQLFLVRHGESLANERNVLQGNTVDEPLNEKGLAQARAAAEALRGCPMTQVFSSRLIRARQTAEAIAAPHGMAVTTLEALHEVDIGVWAGRQWADIRREMPEAWEQYMADHGEFPTPGGESYRDVLNRVHPVFEQLLTEHAGRTIAVVAHNVVNRVYLAHLLGVGLRRSTVIRQHNGAINVIRRDHHGETVAVTVNSILHL